MHKSASFTNKMPSFGEARLKLDWHFFWNSILQIRTHLDGNHSLSIKGLVLTEGGGGKSYVDEKTTIQPLKIQFKMPILNFNPEKCNDRSQ